MGTRARLHRHSAGGSAHHHDFRDGCARLHAEVHSRRGQWHGRQSFSSVAGIILIVAAGGGFKQTLVDSGIGDVIANSITESAMNPLIAGWLVAVLIRLATGSATVATVTASGIMVPLATGMSRRIWRCWCSPSAQVPYSSRT